MKLKVSKKLHVNDKIRDPRQTNMSPEHNFCKLQAARINFEKLLGSAERFSKNHPFQSSSVLPIRGICCFCCVILTCL